MFVSFSFQLLVWAASILMAATQEDTDFGSSHATASASAKAAQTHSVDVGNAYNQFTPASIVAKVGDIIQFKFFPPNHSVARAEAGKPCVPYEHQHPGENKAGFFSGFHYLSDNPENHPLYNLLINDTSPVFFYCSAPTSCINYAMVGVINANASDSLDKQKNAARAAPYMYSPGERPPSNEDGSSPTPLTLATPLPSAAHGKRISSGAIAGIAVGSVVGAGLIGAFLFLLGRISMNLSKKRKNSSGNLPTHPGYESGMPRPYSSKPMSHYEPYTPLSAYGFPMTQDAPAELSSPQPDLNKHASMVSGETAYDDGRWQTISPTPTQQAAVRSELEASPTLLGPTMRVTQG